MSSFFRVATRASKPGEGAISWLNGVAVLRKIYTTLSTYEQWGKGPCFAGFVALCTGPSSNCKGVENVYFIACIAVVRAVDAAIHSQAYTQCGKMMALSLPRARLAWQLDR
jgi:hypothetical protein